MLRRVWSHRSLVAALTYRQYQLRYRQSLIGIAWALAAPLATLAAATFVFSGVAKVDTGEVPYPLFALSAIVPWTFFASSVNFGVQSVSQAAALITRFPFPRFVLPLSVVGSAFIDLGVSAVVFLTYLIATGESLPTTAVWFPLLLVIETAFAVGVITLASSLNVFARDVKLLVPLGLQLWLLLTPVMYPLSAVPASAHALYLLNPMTGLVESFRRVLVYGDAPTIGLLAPSLVGATALLILGIWYFGQVEGRFADVV